MTVRVVDETFDPEVTQARELLASIQPPEPSPQPQVTRPVPKPAKEGLLELMGMVARIMGFRIQLFAGFLGALGIGGYAVYNASTPALIAAGMFNVMVFLPLTILAYKRG